MFLFFHASQKRQAFIESVVDIVMERQKNKTRQRKLKGLCKTRWVERFEAIENFLDLRPSTLTACETLWVHPHAYEEEEEISSLRHGNGTPKQRPALRECWLIFGNLKL